MQDSQVRMKSSTQFRKWLEPFKIPYVIQIDKIKIFAQNINLSSILFLLSSQKSNFFQFSSIFAISHGYVVFHLFLRSSHEPFGRRRLRRYPVDKFFLFTECFFCIFWFHWLRFSIIFSSDFHLLSPDILLPEIDQRSLKLVNLILTVLHFGLKLMIFLKYFHQILFHLFYPFFKFIIFLA